MLWMKGYRIVGFSLGIASFFGFLSGRTAHFLCTMFVLWVYWRPDHILAPVG